MYLYWISCETHRSLYASHFDTSEIHLPLSAKKNSDILSTILELYFGIFDNYETVIEHRLEMKKKNIILKEQEKLAKEYKKKYESAMKQVMSLEK